MKGRKRFDDAREKNGRVNPLALKFISLLLFLKFLNLFYESFVKSLITNLLTSCLHQR